MLAGKDRLHQLEGRATAFAVRGRARQDRPPAADRRVYAAPAAAFGRHQAGAQHRAAALRGEILREIFQMEVILKEDVQKLGHRGDVVKVSDGYGRNFLLPRKMAIEATTGNHAAIDELN